MDPIADAVISLARLTSRFAHVDRVTFLEDGITPESDTDHTVMLGLIACAVAAELDPTLNVGTVAQYALIHDLVEAYAGDTNTFGGITEDILRLKEEREHAALLRIEAELTHLPWVARTIRAYESLEDREARFIKTLDKIMPKLTRIVNERYDTTAEAFELHVTTQRTKITETYAHDQEIALALFDHLAMRALAALRTHEAR